MALRNCGFRVGIILNDDDADFPTPDSRVKDWVEKYTFEGMFHNPNYVDVFVEPGEEPVDG